MNKKIETIWAIISSSSVTDKQTNNISLFNVIEQLNITVSTADMHKAKKEGAFIPHPLDCVILLRSDEAIKDFGGDIEILDPQNKKIFSSKFNSPPIEEEKNATG
jgi:hypothetical protein